MRYEAGLDGMITLAEALEGYCCMLRGCRDTIFSSGECFAFVFMLENSD